MKESKIRNIVIDNFLGVPGMHAAVREIWPEAVFEGNFVYKDAKVERVWTVSPAERGDKDPYPDELDMSRIFFTMIPFGAEWNFYLGFNDCDAEHVGKLLPLLLKE